MGTDNSSTGSLSFLQEFFLYQKESHLENLNINNSNVTTNRYKQLMLVLNNFTFPYQMISIVCILVVFYTITIILNIYHNNEYNATIQKKDHSNDLHKIQSYQAINENEVQLQN